MVPAYAMSQSRFQESLTATYLKGSNTLSSLSLNPVSRNPYSHQGSAAILSHPYTQDRSPLLPGN